MSVWLRLGHYELTDGSTRWRGIAFTKAETGLDVLSLFSSILHLEDAKVASVIRIPQNGIAIGVYVLQVDHFLLLDAYEAAGVAGVHLLGHVGGHRVQALQEGPVPLEDYEAVLVVRVMVADLGVYVIQARLQHLEHPIVDPEVALPRALARLRGMANVHVTMVA